MRENGNTWDKTFDQMLKEGDKAGAVLYALEYFQKNSQDIPAFYRYYEDFLLPPLYRWDCDSEAEALCIWKEHRLSSTIRTIIEMLYPYVVKMAKDAFPDKDKPKAVILCPEEEYHDIGARVVADFFMLNGFDAIHVGANTPTVAIMAALPSLKPDVISISVTNPIHLVATRKMIQTIKSELGKDVKIVVGGRAFFANPKKAEEIGADELLESFDDIQNLLPKSAKGES